MIYEERPAPAGLEAAVARLWYLEMPRVRAFEKILPLPYVHLIFNLSDPYLVHDRAGVATQVDDAFVSGIQSEYLVIASPPTIRHVGAELRAGGLGLLTDAPGGSVAGAVVPAATVMAGAGDLARALRAAAGPDQALDLLTAAMAQRGAGWVADPVVEATLAAVHDDARLQLGATAARAGVSHRTLVTRFRRAAGVTPREYAQIWRFHRFVTALQHQPLPPDWAALAPEAGYYDQPHVVRAFRRFSGWTPTEYLRRVEAFGPDAAGFVPLDEVPGP
ncbi:AraC family transcriptional regulator [Kineosporia sp. R_H_3]|uniref:helix-turn-helix domain-containing protein n=1 Tax=Kineosporia sp. R_H_3 TaxID=1961848 RepID=UPI000B4AE597|nr:AraC family transcriptional regulator [Kineosporia sp. R_H_3]